MEKYDYLIKDYCTIDDAIHRGELRKEETYLILVYVSSYMRKMVESLLEKLKKDFKNAQIAGCSTCHVIYKSKAYVNESVVSFILPQKSSVNVKLYEIDENDLEKFTDNIINDTCEENTKVMLQFIGENIYHTDKYLKCIKEKVPNVIVFGGKAGYIDETNSGNVAVFSRDKILYNAIVVVTISGKELKVYGDSIIGYEPIGTISTFSKVSRKDGISIIDEIDGVETFEWIRNMIGDESFKKITENKEYFESILWKFPIILCDDVNTSRFLGYDKKNNKIISLKESIGEKQKFKLSYINYLSCANKCLDICKKIESIPVEVMLVSSCFVRETFFNNIAEWELTPFLKGNIVGGVMLGELGNYDGKGGAFQGSTCILTMAEEENYIDIDVNAFEDIKSIENSDDRELLLKVLKMQGKLSEKLKIEIDNKVLEEEKNIQDRMFLYQNTKRPNLNKLAVDNEKNIYDKACYIMMERGEFTAYTVGEENFSIIMEEMIQDIEIELNSESREKTYEIYMYNSYSFVIMAIKEFPKERFLKCIEDVYARFGVVKKKKFNVTCVNRFIVIVEQDDLIGKIQSTLMEKQSDLSRFIVYDANCGTEKVTQNEMKMVSIIHEAIENDGVVPYFQPIYDNKTGKIEKFEGLMRLEDKEGKIYTPNMFMDIAKEYRLYIAISSKMITKVFDLFEGRKEGVSINLSAYDINSEAITTMILDRLSKMESAENFVFEIVESEDFRKFSVLMDFIKSVRKYGAKIAVDDFGSGYSNMIEIAKLQPDYIKIDGEIVKEILKNSINEKITCNIIHLANLFEIPLVAEYVENELLQNYVSEKNIEFSQGYYFSPPVRYEELEKFLEK